jgi:cell division protein FtsI/penicillin-binding protein 2
MGADKLYSKSYYCSGEYLNATGDIIKCHNPDGHGEQGVTKALANSCNSFFAQLVADRDLPLDAIERTYINMGYSVNGSKAGRIEVDGINSFKASTTLTDQDDFNTQWGCMGQGETLVSPCQSMMWMSAIANKDGRMTQPHFIRYSTDVFGSVKNEATVSYSDSVFSSQTASEIYDMMVENGTNNYSSVGYPVGVKSGTAQVDEGKKENSLLSGFCTDQDLPIAFCIVIEDRKSGEVSTSEIAGLLLSSIDKAANK